jgi:hypothetical protein
MLSQLHKKLELSNPLQATVFATATIAFWGQCCLGELLGTSRCVHNPRTLPSRCSLASTPKQGTSILLNLLFTKMSGVRGQDVMIPQQTRPADPIQALVNLFKVNRGAKDQDHLFAFQASRGGPFRCLTKEVFLQTCNNIWLAFGHPQITGHCFRIGGTNAYMESGVATDIVKAKGRWKSDAFLVYWHNKNRLAATQTECITLPARSHAARSHAIGGDGHRMTMRPT